jgi:hypothetical protein
MEAVFSGSLMSQRIFADDWRDCLREQYKSVIQQQDTRTEATLTRVLHEVGFTRDELAALKFEATLRADDMPDDYVPEEVAQQYYEGVDIAAEVVEEPVAEVVELVEIIEEEAEDDDEPELLDELPAESDITDDELLDATEPDDDQPQQLSMF